MPEENDHKNQFEWSDLDECVTIDLLVEFEPYPKVVNEIESEFNLTSIIRYEIGYPTGTEIIHRMARQTENLGERVGQRRVQSTSGMHGSLCERLDHCRRRAFEERTP